MKKITNRDIKNYVKELKDNNYSYRQIAEMLMYYRIQTQYWQKMAESLNEKITTLETTNKTT
tara:strand:+ start:1766 stop:1951 length:186 start_codon:yes stop_codon:yes gene_type:complete